jgi:hypothetical protein
MLTLTSIGEQPAELVDQALGQLISAISSVRQLQQLVVHAPLGPAAQVSLGAATQFTDITLVGQLGSTSSAWPGPDLHALTNLKHLDMIMSEGGVPPCSHLPSSLEALECKLEGLEGTAWLNSLEACPGLRTLKVEQHFTQEQLQLPSQDASSSSAAASVLDVAAQHVPGLVALTVRGRRRYNGQPLQRVRNPKTGQLDEPQLRLQPSHAAAQLTQLQRLELQDFACLDITTHQQWRTLSRMASLKVLAGVYIECRPPQGVQLQQLEQLSADVWLSGTGGALLLAACPALRRVCLGVIPKAEQTKCSSGSNSSSSGGGCGGTIGPGGTGSHSNTAAATGVAAAARPVLVQHGTLRQVDINYKEGMTAPAAAAHFAAAAPALAGIHTLGLACPQSNDALPTLPDLAGLTALTKLTLAGVDNSGCVQEEDLLLALQPLRNSLQELSLSKFPLVSPRVVLGLQGLLPALQQVSMSACGRLVTGYMECRGVCRSEEEQLQLLRRFLRPKVVWQEWA